MVKAIWYFTTFSSGKKGKDKHNCDFLVTSKINIENIYINDQKKKKLLKSFMYLIKHLRSNIVLEWRRGKKPNSWHKLKIVIH